MAKPIIDDPVNNAIVFPYYGSTSDVTSLRNGLAVEVLPVLRALSALSGAMRSLQAVDGMPKKFLDELATDCPRWREPLENFEALDLLTDLAQVTYFRADELKRAADTLAGGQ